MFYCLLLDAVFEEIMTDLNNENFNKEVLCFFSILVFICADEIHVRRDIYIQ